MGSAPEAHPPMAENPTLSAKCGSISKTRRQRTVDGFCANPKGSFGLAENSASPFSADANNLNYRILIQMNRILLAVFLGALFGPPSFAQQLLKDTSAVADTSLQKLDTDTVAGRPAMLGMDSLSVASKDTVSVRKDTIPQVPPSAEDSIAVRKDSLAQETPEAKAAPAEVKTPASRSALLDPNGYKDVHWGMTLRETREYLVDYDNVDEYEIRPITNGFEYPGTLAAVKATLAYQFDNDRLYIVRLAPKVKAISRFDFLDSFEEYETTLEAKYGKPTRSGFHKIDELYLNTIESIQLGFAKKYALWEFERTYIVLVLAGHNKRLDVHITYVSRAIFDELKDRIETLKLEDF